MFLLKTYERSKIYSFVVLIKSKKDLDLFRSLIFKKNGSWHFFIVLFEIFSCIDTILNQNELFL